MRHCRRAATSRQQRLITSSVLLGTPNHNVSAEIGITRLDRTFQAFFRRVKNAETPGYPRFKSTNRYDSFTYKQFGNGATLDNGFLVLSKIGRIAVRWSPALEGTPKTVTIRREADGWYVTFSCADVPIKLLPLTGQETGIDLGLASFATLADGSQIANPRIFQVAEMNLKRAQRRVSRRAKGSHRRQKAVRLLAKAHAKVRRARADFHHITALALVRQYDTIYHEDLQTANMLNNHHLAKNISDAGWSAFLSIPYFKAAEAGMTVVVVPPAFTSQVCSGAHCSLLVSTNACPFGGMYAPHVERACIGTTTLPATSCAWEPNDVGPGRPLRR